MDSLMSSAINMSPPPRAARPSAAWSLTTIRLATVAGETLPDMPAWISPCGRVAIHRPAHGDAGRDLTCAILIGGRALRVGTANASAAAVAWASRAVAAAEAIGASEWREADSSELTPYARAFDPIRRAFEREGAHVV